MAVFPTKFVKLKDRKSNDTCVYEVAQVIYGEAILGVSCITEHGIVDFYFSEYQMIPLGNERSNYEFRYKN